ncbi:MAG TPA: YihY/virulence factor BrkB family protein [Anaerolineales bacterium]|nr:YihY/virulence factor BrkB family protein [Anaerolineales bacterium]
MKALSNLLDLFKRAYQDWKEDRASRLAASLAYYTIFSIAPLLVIAIAVAGFIWERESVEAQVIGQIHGLVGTEGAIFVGSLIESASGQAEGVIATVVGIITLLFGALGVFNELHNALNVIWEVKVEEAESFLDAVKKAIFDRLLSFTMVLGIGFLLLVSLVISAGLSATQELLGNTFPIPEFFLQLINLIISIAVISVLFAMIYKYLPDAEIPWKYIWPGAFATAILFSLGKLLIGLYLGNSAVASSFGAAGSLVLLLVWVYYSAQILFFGAEFTQVYANTYGPKILPDEKVTGAKTDSRPRKDTRDRVPKPLPNSSFEVRKDPVTNEKENQQFARFVLGLMVTSFLTGIMTTIWGLKKR